MISKLIKIALLLFTLVSTNTAWSFGKVEATVGKVSRVDLDGQTSELAEGSRVKASDTILTDDKGEVLIKTDDDGVILLKPNTKFTIEAYAAKGNDKDMFAVKLFKGALRGVTGFIGKTAPKHYRLTTTAATIGIRGTDYELQIVEAAQGNLPAGTFAKVNAGEISMTNRGISVNVAANQYGLATSSSPPQLLESPPAELFKPSKLDDKTQEMINSLTSNSAENSTLKTKQDAQQLGGGNTIGD